MSIEAELGQYVLQTHTSKKFWRFIGGWTPLTPPLGTVTTWWGTRCYWVIIIINCK